MAAESAIFTEDPTLRFFNSTPSIQNKFLPGSNLDLSLEQQITQSFDQLSTNEPNSSEDSDERSRKHLKKKVRVGNHYQARIPKFFTEFKECPDSEELLWSPFVLDQQIVERYLTRISSMNRLLIPMGAHLRDDEDALYVLKQCNYNPDSAWSVIGEKVLDQKPIGWSEEECRSFESGLLVYGKNFFRIQRNKLTKRSIGELVQFYYLWKKTARYDLFASRLRTGRKKYAINPGVSDLMCRYLGRQNGCPSPLSSDVQCMLLENGQEGQNQPQY